ncbi:MAG: cupin domain-containing protein [Deltaproteobacteria bacterium]|nr:cupin domain-containing protein [Deltaproteobacteria bacterium]
MIKTDNVSVRILELEEGEALPWHHHSEVTDYVFALDGEIEVQLRSPDETVALKPGQRCDIPTGRVHRVVNMHKRKTKYLLIQGIGKYDFNKASS